MNILKKILVIAPHADDEILGCGGTINKLKRLGHEVHLIICSKREQDISEYEDIWNYSNSYHDLQFLDEHLNRKYLLKEIEVIYNKIKPDIVYIPNKDDFNHDHKEVYKACEVVLRRYQEHQPEKILMYEVPSSTTQSFKNNFKCNYYETLGQDDLEFKINNFLKYKNEIRDWPNPRNARGITVYAQFRGMECNAPLAEGFNLIYQKS